MRRNALVHHAKGFDRSGLLKVLFFCLFFSVLFLTPTIISANETGKLVRAGWYESPFNMMEARGRRSGWAGRTNPRHGEPM